MKTKKKAYIAAILAAWVLVTAVGGAIAYTRYLLYAEGHYFDSNGVRIHYFDKGKGTPVILVHGLGINAQMNWMTSGVFWHLANKYRVIALDVRGHGRSGKPHDPNQYGPEMAEDVVRLMDHLKIDKAHVVGYSMGGFIVIKLLTMHPERLLSAAPCGAGWAANPEKDLAFLDQIADDLDHGKGFEQLLAFLRPVGKQPRTVRTKILSHVLTVINDVPAIAAAVRSMRQLQVTEAQLRANRVPTLAVIGAKDPLKVFADQLAAVTSNLRLVVVQRGNHMTTLRRRGAIEALDRFLAEHSPGAPETKPAANANHGEYVLAFVPPALHWRGTRAAVGGE